MSFTLIAFPLYREIAGRLLHGRCYLGMVKWGSPWQNGVEEEEEEAEEKEEVK